MKKTEQKIIEFISRHKLIKAGDKLLVAFSGGPDSVFALYFFNKFRQKYKIEIEAVHFNHLLRGKESDKDETFAVEFCSNYKIPIRSRKIDVKSFADRNKMSIEEAARTLRYTYLDSLSKELNCNKIVTAHNQSDNTETVLLNIVSGSGLNGFTGVPIVRGNIIRPLLCLSKKEIMDFLENNKIPFRVDSSNLKSDYKRNYLRNKVIPLLKSNINPSIDSAVFRSSKILESALQSLRNELEKKSIRYFHFKDSKLKIDLRLFEDFEPAIAGDLLKKVFKNYFNLEFAFSCFEKLSRLALQQKGKSVQLGGDLKTTKEEGFILIEKSSNLNSESALKISVDSTAELFGKKIGIEKTNRSKLLLNKNRNIEFVDGSKLNGMFILRRWKSGDRLIPLGMKNFKKVSDFLTDSKVSSADKKNQLVLTNGNNIVWVVGLRIDDRFKINSQTKKIYKLWVK
jgi:tRNA(Ile)-lysidine synthase